MPTSFRFSKFLRNDEKEKFLNYEEKVQNKLGEIFESKIIFKNRAGAVKVEINTPKGEVVQDILRKDMFDYNYCVDLVKLALGVKDND